MLHTCERGSENGKRIYTTKSGQKYPSITTVLAATKDMEGLNRWRDSMGEQVADYIMRTAANIGTDTHRLIEDHLNGMVVDVESKPLLAQAHYNNLKPYLDKVTDVRGLEIMLHSDELKLAGTADCIAKFEGELSICDWKTKRSTQRLEYVEDHLIQGTAYAYMWQEHHHEEVKKIVILASIENGKSQIFTANPIDYKDKLMNRITQYNEGRGTVNVY